MGHYGLFLLALSSSFAQLASSQPAQVPFTDCTSSTTRSASNYDPNARINVSSVFAQIAYPHGQKTLRLRLVGQAGEVVQPSATNSKGIVLSTLFSKSSFLTFTLNANTTWICQTARPPSPLPAINETAHTYYCPIPAGQLAWSVDTPLQHEYNLTSIITRIRVVYPSEPERELTCVDIDTTLVRPGQNKTHNIGYPQAIFWLSVGLVIAYWVVIGVARISSAWSRGVARGPGWSSVRWAGTVFASAVSAERLSTHSALLRFATPSYRDVLFHTQWCAALAMIAVQWPTFVYPILSNTAWSTLIYNITLQAAAGNNTKWDPWAHDYSPPSSFADQFSDVNSPLYLDTSLENNIYTFPSGTQDGIASFAYAVGVFPENLFGLCLKIWLLIVGAAIVLSLGIWFVDWFVSSCMMGGRRPGGGRGLRRGSINDVGPYPASEAAATATGPGQLGKDPSDMPMLRNPDDENGQIPRSIPGTRPGVVARRRWWHHRLGQSSFHGSILQGNLVRLLILFHLPITIFSTYEFSRRVPSKRSASSVALSALAFTSFSVLIPILLIARLAMTPTKKLYDATRTLLALGPLYSHYAHGAQMFAIVVLGQSLAVGITIGAGQGSGTAQAIILLVIEVASALATSIWLPWGERASMGVVSFLFCVARIITVVLLIILSPLVSVDPSAGGWIAYAIILIQGLVYLALFSMLVVKIIEAFVRLFGHVPFDKATHSMDSGLLGALSQAGCCGVKRKPAKRRGKHSGGAATTTVSNGSKHTPNSSLGATGGGRPGTSGGLYQQPGSYHSSPSQVGQLSFLRPEQAFQPYREDADDESGFIMGAWAGSAGYLPVANEPGSPIGVPEPPKASGFSRVAGGRARHDDPFATLPPTAVSAAVQARTGYPSFSPGGSHGLPPGAMPPRAPQGSLGVASGRQHSRIHSHAAIIENAGGGALVPPPPRGVIADDDSSATGSSVAPKKGGGGFWLRKVASSPNQRRDSYDDEDTGVGNGDGNGGNVGRSWFGRLMHRSEGDAVPLTPPPPPEEPGPSSFVVMRNKKPSASSSAASASKPEGPRATSARGDTPKSEDAPKPFVVVRPKRSSLPPGSTLLPPSRDADKRAST